MTMQLFAPVWLKINTSPKRERGFQLLDPRSRFGLVLVITAKQ